MKLLTLSILLILSSNFVEAQSIPRNKEMVRQQMNAGQRMIQQGYVRNEQIMNTQEAIRYDRQYPRTRYQTGAR
jgi:hypothetical protein